MLYLWLSYKYRGCWLLLCERHTGSPWRIDWLTWTLLSSPLQHKHSGSSLQRHSQTIEPFQPSIDMLYSLTALALAALSVPAAALSGQATTTVSPPEPIPLPHLLVPVSLLPPWIHPLARD